MIALSLAIFGALLILTPMILAMLAGVEDENDLINWLVSQSFENIFVIRAMMLSGSGFIWAGVVIFYLPS